MAPDNSAIKFNIAFVQFTLADMLRALPETSRTSSEISAAAAGLESAIETLTSLVSDPNPPYPADEIQQRANMGQNTLRRQLERALQQQTEFEKTNSDRLDEAKRLREAEEQRRQKVLDDQKAIEVARQAELADQRRKMQEEAKEWALHHQMPLDVIENDASNDELKAEDGEAKKKARKSKARKPKRIVEDEEDAGNVKEENGIDLQPAKKRKLSQKFESAERVVSSDEDDTVMENAPPLIDNFGLPADENNNE